MEIEEHEEGSAHLQEDEWQHGEGDEDFAASLEADDLEAFVQKSEDLGFEERKPRGVGPAFQHHFEPKAAAHAREQHQVHLD